jgi:hypothetical protein
MAPLPDDSDRVDAEMRAYRARRAHTLTWIDEQRMLGIRVSARPLAVRLTGSGPARSGGQRFTHRAGCLFVT